MAKDKLILVTTVPDTLGLLTGYGRFLSRWYEVLLVSSPGRLLEEAGARECSRVHAVSMRRGFSCFRDVLSIISFYLLLRRERPTVVHSFTPKAGLVGMVAACLAGVPLRIHSFTGLIFPTASQPKRALLAVVDWFIAACTISVVAESEGVRRALRQIGVPEGKLQIVGYGHISGVDTTRFRLDDEFLGHRESGGNGLFRFIYVGRIHRDKGINELLEAFSGLPDSATLTLVGGIDPEGPLDESTLQSMTVSPRVTCLGAVDDVRPFLANADCLVLPSYREGFPNVLLEAAAMELPVVSTRVFGAEDFVLSGITGFLVASRDVFSLREGMLNIMRIPGCERRLMGKEARSIVLKKYERVDVYERHRALYSGLTSCHQRIHE